MYPEHRFDSANHHSKQDKAILKKRDEERKARKKLIAAAPDLLEVCKNAYNIFKDLRSTGEHSGELTLLEATLADAITKAEKQS